MEGESPTDKIGSENKVDKETKKETEKDELRKLNRGNVGKHDGSKLASQRERKLDGEKVKREEVKE